MLQTLVQHMETKGKHITISREGVL